mgnify:CR=1 FL=1
MKIGIFGGSFNPPHKMHESIASQLIERKLIEYAEPLLDKLTEEINNNIKPDLALNLGDLVEDFNDHDKDKQD